MAEKLTIRKANIDDLQIITQLGITTFTDTFAADNKQEDMDKYLTEEMNTERIAGELQDSNNTFYLAVYDNNSVGFAKVRSTKIPSQLTGKSCLEIERLYVLKAYHALKIGARLMQQCIDHATLKQCNIIWLGVWEHNKKAIDFYSRWGFVPFDKHIFRLGNDEQTDVLMKKML